MTILLTNLLSALLPITGIVISWVGMLFVSGKLEPRLLASAYAAIPSEVWRLALTMLTAQFVGVLLIIRGIGLNPTVGNLAAIFAGALCPLLAALYLENKAPSPHVVMAFIVVLGGLLYLNWALTSIPARVHA